MQRADVILRKKGADCGGPEGEKKSYLDKEPDAWRKW